MNYKNFSIKIIWAFVLLLPSVTAGAANKGKVVQIDVHKILNARSVTTLGHEKLTTWTTGIDGNGLADGYLTMKAALFMGDDNPMALPDNPLFPATDKHPEILLHYSNDDRISNQTLAIAGAGAFNFQVPAQAYSNLFLAFTSAEGASNITVELQYENSMETKSFVIPDYYLDIAEDDKDFCYLAHNLAKWGVHNNMTEKDHHNIDLLNVSPNPEKSLNM